MNIKFILASLLATKISSDLNSAPLSVLASANTASNSNTKLLFNILSDPQISGEVFNNLYDTYSKDILSMSSEQSNPLLEKRYKESQDAKCNQKVNNATKEVLFNILSNPKLSDKAFNNLYDTYNKDIFSMPYKQFKPLFERKSVEKMKDLYCVSGFGLLVIFMILKGDKVLQLLNMDTTFSKKEVLFNILSDPQISGEVFNNLYNTYNKDIRSMSEEQFYVLLNKRYPTSYQSKLLEERNQETQLQI